MHVYLVWLVCKLQRQRTAASHHCIQIVLRQGEWWQGGENESVHIGHYILLCEHVYDACLTDGIGTGRR